MIKTTKNSLPMEALREHGVLWAINTYIFHPRGYALTFVLDLENELLTGWFIQGNGTEPWGFSEDQREFEAFEQLLFDHSQERESVIESLIATLNARSENQATTSEENNGL